MLKIFAVVALTGCTVIEPEQRSSSAGGTILRSTGTPAEPVVSIAQRPTATSDLWPTDAPEIHAKSAILIDADSGRTLYQKNADMPRQVASTQKLLTALIIAERGDLDAIVTIQSSDTDVEPTKVGMRAGQAYPRRQLLNALLVHSCNDAAVALARDAAGSTQEFAYLMNARAQALGATSSHFVNPNGLPAPQYSTARDMARIAYRDYRHPELREIMRQTFYPFRFNSGRVSYLETTNRLLGRVAGVDGMKTGYTDAAGRCLITSATVNGRHYILVQLGSRTSYIFNDAQTMLAWAASR
ncbi:MAG: D-alanyl-D-alanine carboxypeptidase family protein [Chthoniobacterales bacterium]